MHKNRHVDNKIDLLNEPLAIVGANCQFPGMDKDVENLDALYDMLLNEQTPIKEVPKNRWDINTYYDADREKEDKIVSRKGGFLDDPRLFDAAFFKISAIEAKQIDPQHRLFLEVSVRALNDANILLDSLKNSNTGVYCGLGTHDYSQLNYKDKIQFNAYTCIGSAGSAAAGRLSHFLDLKGPCITADTACSSSFSALYLAAMALQTQQCDMAIVGGVHLNLSPEVSVGLSKANMLSAVGESRSFDAQADGYVRSEGCAVVILKRLSDALKDENKILAVMKGIIMNQDGAGASIVAPNTEAQIAMHRLVLEKANFKASDIDYIEAHGTGTIRGDAVELQAIHHIHQGEHAIDNPLIIGALKSNLGHTISASGLAALLKVIGCFKKEIIPANLHYSTPNPAVDPNSIPALFPVQPTPFPKRSNKKRVVQISNFGFTGTNVSAIIEEPPTITVRNERIKDNDKPLCFVISANSKFSLHQMLNSYLHYLKTIPVCLSDLCYSLINNRDHYKYRCAIITQDNESLIRKIESSDYAIIKTIVKQETIPTGNDALQIYESFLSGANIRSDKSKIKFNPVDLPLYVFDRKNYWHDVRAIRETSVPEDWCFELKWQEQPLDKNHYRTSGKRWLIIGESQEDFGLREKGLTLFWEEDHYSIDELDGIIFAAHFYSSPAESIDLRIDNQKNVLKKILALLQKLNDKASRLRLVFLIADLNLDGSQLIGFCKTLCLELPQYQTILIQLNENDKNLFADQIIDELNCNYGEYHEHLVAYHKTKRLVSRLTKTSLPMEKELRHPNARYLITGGCGGLGLVSAEALLSAGAKELMLVSRTVNTQSIAASIKKLQSSYPDRIIRVLSLDVSDKASLKKMLLSINQDGLLKGIIHAAGASRNKALLEHQNEDIDQLFSAKVKGAWYLHALTQHCDLDFFVVYSSISSVFGSNKEAFYSASNSFLDALISERQRLGLVGMAVQWGPWAEVGMAKKRSRDPTLKDALIHNDQGIIFIKRLINCHLSHAAIISPSYLQFMLDFVPKTQPAFYKALACDLTPTPPSPHEEFLPWLSDYPRLNDNQQIIVCKTRLFEICKELLGITKIDELDEDAGFFDVGFDSLMMAELASRLKEDLKPFVNIVATIAFDYPSINKLARHIQSQLNNHFLSTQQSKESAQSVDDAIAIIGMSCSLPNAPNITAFEQLLENGLSGIKEIPLERWDNRLYYDPNPDAPGKTNVNQLGLLDNIKLFDPQFFGISPREAPFIEPQQRLFLENCYHALENANYPVQSLAGSSTGVYAGVGSSQEYYTLLEKKGFSQEVEGMFSITGKSLNMVSGRVSHAFDFKGPALSIDTACSSSLVAIHYACNSLKRHEIDYALAGGVNIILRPEGLIHLSKAKALSPDGQCKSFDESANGYARSEGCGVVFLKRLTDALRDEDKILAVIKGSAINNDGKSAGLTVPNGKSQEDVMRKALDQAQLVSSDISFIEAQGTGTSLGDPIEAHAINAVYGKQRNQDNPLYMGSVKTNIGHLESASGVAGLIKVIIGLQKKRIYKHLNFNRLNTKIKLDDIQIALHNHDWHSNTSLKSAGVCAFGFSGTNAHVILQEAPQNIQRNVAPLIKTNALILSAKSQMALDNLVQCYQQFLATTNDDFTDLCYTAAIGRDHYPYRLVVVANNAPTAGQLLKNREYATSKGEKNNLDLHEDPTLHLLVNDYLQGKQVDWVSYFKTCQQLLTKVTLPNYPFARSEFWLATENTIQNELAYPLLEEKHQNEAAFDPLYKIEWSSLDTNPQTKTLSDQSFLIFLQQHSPKEQIDILIQTIREIAVDVLRFESIEQINNTSDLFTLGMDSLMFLELRSRIHDKLQCPDLNLPIEHFINDSRVDKITNNIAKELQKFFSQDQNPIQADNLRSGATPLSDTQYGFWLNDKMGVDFNCPKQIQLHGPLNLELLYKALAFTVNKNGAFWLNFHKEIPIQMQRRGGQFTWSYEDISAIYDQQTLNKVFYDNTRQLISLTEQPLIKVHLYKLKEEVHELHIIIPHIILDESSYRIFLKQLKNNYETLLHGKTLIPVQEQYGYLDYVKQNNSHYQKDIADKIDFWEVYNTGFQKLSFGSNHHLPDATLQTENLYHYQLDEQFVEKFKAWHQERNINVSTGLMAAFQIVFYKISTQKKIPFMVLHNGREGSRYADVMGLFIEYKRINTTLNENYTFMEFFKSLENEFIKAAPFQSCSQYIKNSGLNQLPFSILRHAIKIYYQLFLTKKFKVSHQNSTMRSHYLTRLSMTKWFVINFDLKEQFNKLFKTNLRLLKPNRLMVVFNITAGFFIKQPQDNHFSNLKMTIPNHYGSVDRPIGNQTLWIYFTKDQHDQYQLSINGPLTKECKDLMAHELKQVMTKIMENGDRKIKDLI